MAHRISDPNATAQVVSVAGREVASGVAPRWLARSLAGFALLVPVVSIVLVAGVVGCKHDDPRFCCTTEAACQRPGGSDDMVPCPAGQVCDNEGSQGPSRTCVPATGVECNGPADCQDPGKPLC